jgi:hypothetical protein
MSLSHTVLTKLQFIKPVFIKPVFFSAQHDQ